MKERIMNQLGDSLREHRPSQNEQFTQRVQFLIAVRTGDLSTVRRLLQADPSFVRATLPREQWGEPEMGQPTLPLEFDYTPLHFAATYGHLELARVLLAHGADVDDATPGETPLDRAACTTCRWRRCCWSMGPTPIIRRREVCAPCIVPRFAGTSKSCACCWRTGRTHSHVTLRDAPRWIGQSSMDGRKCRGAAR
jgi:Ankyrin repeats (many copies)